MRTANHFRLALVIIVAVTALAAYRGEEPAEVAPPPQTPLQTVVSSPRQLDDPRTEPSPRYRVSGMTVTKLSER